MYANPESLDTGNYPPVDRGEDTVAVMYLGLQYGPRADEVLYLAFAGSGLDKPFSSLFVYGPGHPAYGTPVSLKPRKKKVGDVRSMGYEMPPFKTAAGGIEVQYEFEFVCGWKKAHVVFVKTHVQLKRGTDTCSFFLGGELNDYFVTGGPIKVLRLLADPQSSFTVHTQSPHLFVVGHLLMGRLPMAPDKGTERDFLVTIARADGKVVEKKKIRLEEESLEASKHGGSLQYRPEKLKPGQDYTFTGSMDLGPLLGKIEIVKEKQMPGE